MKRNDILAIRTRDANHYKPSGNIGLVMGAITRVRLQTSLENRLKIEINSRNPVKFLVELSVEETLNTAIEVLYLYTRVGRHSKKKTVQLSEMATAIGKKIRAKNKLPKDSSLAVKAGAFVLFTLESAGLILTKKGHAPNGHATYLVEVLLPEALTLLWETLPVEHIDKLPSLTPYEPWTTVKHPTGITLIKTQNKDVLGSISPETHPILFDCVNKAQSIGWKVNEGVFPFVNWALRNRADAFSDIWDVQSSEAKQSKLREAHAITSIAKHLVGKIFYHRYYYDFRGRKYPSTAYFHEQGSDLAKGLLLREDCKPMGRAGFNWLLTSIANNWAGDAGRADGYKTDKIPIKDRIEWAIDNEEILLSYAESPKVNQGWMKADKPWQFLAACIELMNLRVWQVNYGRDLEDYEYSSHLECFIDGSNNGAQHLSALTKDEDTAPHVNLVPLPLPGDLYKYVAEHVWAKIDAIVAKYSAEEYRESEELIAVLSHLKMQINHAAPKSEKRKELVEELQDFKKENDLLISVAAPVFWHKITDTKSRRKICKRNVMTLPYGGTAYGLGQQQIDDARKHGIDSLMTMEHRWGSYMGREVFEDCKESLKRPMRLLGIFEAAGRKAEKEGRFLSWVVPITNFPVVQSYTEGIVKKVWVQYGPPIGERLLTGYFENTLQLSVCFTEEHKISTGKQAQGASPNAIHSLDAAHLMLTVHRADFPITTIHDSFGCLLADMPKLFTLIRHTFVELYEADPLTSLMTQIGGNLADVEIGNLDLHDILESEYCFA